MSRNVRNQVILAELESTYGVDPTPTGAANAILCSNPRIVPLAAQNVDRALVRPYLGGSEQLVGTRNVTVEFTVELAGSGTAGTAPAWGPLLKACAFAETVTASTRVDYLPVTSSQASVTMYWYDDGVLHKMTGARGNVVIAMNSGERPELRFSFTGLYSTPTSGSPTGVSFAAFVTPLVVTDANSGNVTLGGTVAATGAPAITSGTSYPSLGLELDVGNGVAFTPLLGGETVDITDRAVMGTMRLNLTAAEEVTLYGTVLDATLTAVSLQHGTTAGNKVIAHLPSVQLYEPSKEELNGLRLIGYRLRGVPDPAGTGNDELRLVVY